MVNEIINFAAKGNGILINYYMCFKVNKGSQIHKDQPCVDTSVLSRYLSDAQTVAWEKLRAYII